MAQSIPFERPVSDDPSLIDHVETWFAAHAWTQWFSLAAVTLLAFGLNAWALDENGWGNTYYAAAARSMSGSWKNFFFNAFDPGGFITVDKPPVFLWIGGLSARIFGYSSWSILLPSAVAGAASVALVWLLTKKYFGVAAATVAGAVLAVTPISVAVNRLNLPEPFLVLALAGALAATLRSLESKRWWLWVALAGALVGVAFNTKMLAAWIPGPAFALALIAGHTGWNWHGLRRLAFSLALLAGATFAVSFSWMLIVDAVPASDRPYIGGSSDNSVQNLALDYNGLGRVNGDEGRGPGGRPPGNAQPNGGAPNNPGAFPNNNTLPRNGTQPNGNLPNNNRLPRNGTAPVNPNGGFPNNNIAPNGNVNPGGGFPNNNFGPNNNIAPNSNVSPNGGFPNNNNFGPNNAFRPNGGGPGGFNGPAGANGRGPGGIIAGEPGLGRMFDSANAQQIAWFLPFALLGSLVCAVAWWRSPVRRAAIVIALGWVLLFGGVFSLAQGIYHSYYTAALAPGIAILAGMTIAAGVELFRRSRFWILPLAGIFAATLWVQLVITGRFQDFETEAPPIAIGVVLAAGIVLGLSFLVSTRVRLTAALLAGVAGLLVIPTAWSLYEVENSSMNTTLPQAGPREGAAGRSFGSGPFDAGVDPLASWLETHQDSNARWDLAVTSAQQASTLIAAHNLSVMALGGFSGGDPTITASQFADYVAAGDIRYVLVGGEGPGGRPGVQRFRPNGQFAAPNGFAPGGQAPGSSTTTSAAKGSNAVMRAVEQACKPVPATGSGFNGSLYDCSGAANALKQAS